MSSMVERVARAVCRRRVELDIEADGFAVPTNPDFYAGFAVDEMDRAIARTAIEALREPTAAMVEAAYEGGLDWGPGGFDNDASAEKVWPLMITAALTEPTP